MELTIKNHSGGSLPLQNALKSLIALNVLVLMDRISKKTRSKVMQAIKSKHTKPELLLRKELSRRGYRYRLHYGPYKIDIAFPSKKVAIFVDGCFWHQCPLHSHKPKSNKSYWGPKLKRNIKRDKKTNYGLRLLGWTVLRVWEHELGCSIPKKLVFVLKACRRKV